MNQGRTSSSSLIEKHIIDYYTDLFKSQDPSQEEIDVITNCIRPLVTDDMNAELNAPFTETDILKALNDLNPNKAPGPNGFSAGFYQKEWHVIKADVINTVLGILNNGEQVRPLNNTIITLIPKKKDPTTVKDCRPINICNDIFKIVARTITNRLKSSLGDIIDPCQSAFIPGRAITDNIMLGFECMHWFSHSKSRKGYAALKLDMTKAYDRVEWNYLEKILNRLGFKNKMVNLIMNCIKSVKYSININGRITGNIQPSR